MTPKINALLSRVPRGRPSVAALFPRARFRARLLLAGSIGALLACTATSRADNRVWYTGPGVTWSDPLNWLNDTFPTSGDAIAFDEFFTGSLVNTHLDASFTVQSLSFNSGSHIFGIDANASGSTARTLAFVGGGPNVNGGTELISLSSQTTGTITIGGLANVGVLTFAFGTHNATINVANAAASLVFGASSDITGTAGLTKSGAGTLTLRRPKSISGPVIVSAGTLVLDNSGGGGAVLAQGTSIVVSALATLRLTGDDFNAFLTPNLTVGAGGMVVAASTTKNAHTLGTTLLQGGTLTSSTAADPVYGNFVLGPNSTLTANGDTPSAITSAVFQVDSGTAISVGTQTDNVTPALLTISAQIQNVGNTGVNPFTKNGPGTLVLSGVNIYTGSTVINGGTVQFTRAASLYNSTTAVLSASVTAANFIVQSGATALFNVGGTGEFSAAEIGQLAGLGTASGGFRSGSTIAIDTTNATGVITLTLANPNGGANALGFAKLGAGAVILSGTNTFTGATAIRGGSVQYPSPAALYNSTTAALSASVTAANWTVQNGATAIFNFGGPADFTAAEIAQLAGLGTATGGFRSGSTIALDTTNAQGPVGIGSVLANPNGGANTLSFLKLGPGTLSLTAVNTYSGPTIIRGGTLEVSSVANGGTASGLGRSSNAASNLVIDGGTLRYTGSTATTDRDFAIGAGGATIDASGSGTLTIGNGGMAFTGPAGARSLTFTGTGTGIIVSSIVDNGAGATSVTKTGSGTWLVPTSTYSGPTTIGGGKFIANIFADGGASSSLGRSSNAATNLVLNGGTLQVGGLNQSSNRLFSLGPNGGAILTNSVGVVTFTNPGAIGFITPNTTATLSGTGTVDFYPTLGNNGNAAVGFTKTGVGVWTLRSANTYTGPTIVNGGGLILDNTTALSVLHPDSQITVTNATLQFAGTHVDSTPSTALLTVGVGGFVNATGTVNNSHALGDTLLQGGTLGSNNVTDATFGNFVLAAGKTLTANGDTDSSITAGVFQLGAGAALSVGTKADGSPSLLTISSQIQNYGNSLATANPLVKNGAGTLILSGVNTYTGSTTVNGGILRFATQGSLYNSTSAALSASVTASNLIVQGGATAAFGFGGAVDFTAAEIDQLAALGTAGGGFRTGSSIGLDTTNASVPVTYASVLADPNGGANALGFVKFGSGTLILSGANTYSGPTVIRGGTLSVDLLSDGGVPSNLGRSSSAAANLVLDGGALQYAGSAAQATDRLFTLGIVSSVLDASGAGLFTLSNTGAVAFIGTNISRTLTLTGTGSGSFAPHLGDNGTGPTYLAKQGSGTWTLATAQAYSGVTSIYEGTLAPGLDNAVPATSVLAIGASGTFALGNFNNLVAGVSLTGGSITGTGGILTSSTAYSIQSGSVSAILGGNVALTKTGGGLATLSGQNTYTGGTNIYDGTLRLGSLGALGTTGAITFGDTGALQFTEANSTDYSARFNQSSPSFYTLDTDGPTVSVTLGTPLTGSQSGLVKRGVGTLILGVGNTYGGSTTIEGGTLAMGNNDVLPANAWVIVTGGTLALGNFSDNIGTLWLWSGSITGTGGVLGVSSSFSFQSGSVSAILGGGASLDKNTGGTVILSGANFYTGGTNISGGVLQLGNGGTTGSLSPGSAIANSANLTFNRSNTITQGTDFGAISGSGSVTQAGTGKTILTGTNTYSGATIVTGGTLQLNGPIPNSVILSASISGRLQLGAADRLNNAAALDLKGGVFDTAGFSETVGTLSLSSGVASTIDLGNGASVLHFAASNTKTWNGTLTIENWSGSQFGGGADQLFFGSTAFGLTAAQVAAVYFHDPVGMPAGMYTGWMLSTGELVVPEPGTATSLLGGLVTLLGLQRPRRRRGS